MKGNHKGSPNYFTISTGEYVRCVTCRVLFVGRHRKGDEHGYPWQHMPQGAMCEGRILPSVAAGVEEVRA